MRMTAYAYQDDYGDDAEEPARKRGGGMITVAVVLALAVVGTGAAFAYRTYVGSPRSGEPPIIKADNSPTKIVPAPSDGSAKVPDRMATGDGAEKIVPREEAPVDVNARTGPRVVFPPLNQNSNPPSAASVAPAGVVPAAPATVRCRNGASRAGSRPMPSVAIRLTEPRRRSTRRRRPNPRPLQNGCGASGRNCSGRACHARPAIIGQCERQRADVAGTAGRPVGSGSIDPGRDHQARVAAAPSNGGGYLVQVASQKNECDAQASYRALQGKYPAVLGSRSPVIKRADLGDKGVYYRAMIGPFGSADEATQFCGNLKTAGGQCVVQRN